MKELGNNEYVQELINKGIDLGVEAGKSIIIAIIIYFVGKGLISLINRMLVGMMVRKNIDPAIQSFTKSLVNILLMVLLVISVVSALGVNTTSFAALLASAGVAVGMALSGNLQNLAGGIVILLFRPFRVGDYIEAQGTGGTVTEIQIFHTILTTADNKKIYLPNGALSSGNITNYSKEPLRRVDFTVGVEYGEDIDKVRKALSDILSMDERVLQEPAPVIVLGSLADSSVNMSVRVWVKSENYWSVYFETNEKIYNEFNRLGINFPYPQLTIHQG
ncbi:MAG: mechanosensitive ion channel [Bacteroidaceae bacterium]|nr:mechanosensitive ion channel [Bacteroidaceae bacterium]MBO5794073.1 mechanosensitive ion channel [Bacteroidaceae bacterium]